jgi:ankyrin repeat protein
MVDLLIENNANLNATSKDGNTALHIAAEHGHRKLIKTLLNRRINSRTANLQGATALQLAVGTASDEATVPLLIKSRFDMDVQNVVTGNTALHLAVELKRPRIILFLIEKGANLNILNREGLTPLQLACKIDNCEAVSLLLERGAKLETRSSSNNTALHIAASEGNWIAFDLLVTGGADINAWNSEGDSLLHEQAQKGLTTSIMAHLLENGANIEACNSQGFTSLQCAALSGNKANFLCLVEEGANAQVHTAKGETLLHITPPLNQNYIDILTILLELGLNPNAITCSGLTPIHNVITNHLDVIDLPLDKVILYISLLLSHGANINAQLLSHKSETALHLALSAKTPQEPLVLFLVKSGAALDAKTIDGRTPLHLAVECSRHSILALLLNSGADPMIKAPSESSSNRRPAPFNGAIFDFTAQNTAKVLQVYETSNPHRPSPDSQRDSITTDIDELEIGSDTDGIGGSTLVGEDGSIWGSRASTTSDNPSILSSS